MYIENRSRQSVSPEILDMKMSPITITRNIQEALWKHGASRRSPNLVYRNTD